MVAFLTAPRARPDTRNLFCRPWPRPTHLQLPLLFLPGLLAVALQLGGSRPFDAPCAPGSGQHPRQFQMLLNAPLGLRTTAPRFKQRGVAPPRWYIQTALATMCCL